MSEKQLLFITEGENDEPKFIKKIFEKCYPNVKYKYYTYCTDIYTLSKLIFNDNEIDQYLDIKNVLKENEKSEYKREVLSKKYTDIILVFDFDPQCTNPEFKKIEKMIEFFNDSTNNGKLYINYPMMQSYKHINTFPDEDINFKNRYVEFPFSKSYKEIVDNESKIKNLSKYNYPIIMKIIGYHLKKVNYLLTNRYEVPDCGEFNNIDLLKIYKLQCKNKVENNLIYVLNTFVLNVIEYNPQIMLRKIREFSI